MIMKKDVEVTFHRMTTFTETFIEFYHDFQMLNESLNPKFNRDMVFKAGTGAGRSGSFFFFSHDKKFIIKTVSKNELNIMLELIPEYANHFMSNPDSLLAKCLGLFTIKSS